MPCLNGIEKIGESSAFSEGNNGFHTQTGVLFSDCWLPYKTGKPVVKIPDQTVATSVCVVFAGRFHGF
jgi:hypothetical protein